MATDDSDGTGSVDDLFAENFRRVRERRQLSQSAVAEAMTVAGFSFHQQTIGSIENGSRRVRIGEACALAEILRVDLTDLLKPIPEDEKRRELLAVAERRLRAAKDRAAVAEFERSRLADECRQAREKRTSAATTREMTRRALMEAEEMYERATRDEVVLMERLTRARQAFDVAACDLAEAQEYLDQMTYSDGEG